ncbi:MAG: hypothetical protein AAEC10_03780, partial [Rhodospirillales bacterium]
MTRVIEDILNAQFYHGVNRKFTILLVKMLSRGGLGSATGRGWIVIIEIRTIRMALAAALTV